MGLQLGSVPSQRVSLVLRRNGGAAAAATAAAACNCEVRASLGISTNHTNFTQRLCPHSLEQIVKHALFWCKNNMHFSSVLFFVMTSLHTGHA